MDLNQVLDFLDDDARKTAYAHNLKKLQTSSRIDPNTLRICIRLLPQAPDSHVSLAHEELWDYLLQHLPEEQDVEHLYEVADICLSNDFAAAKINAKVHSGLEDRLVSLLGKHEDSEEAQPIVHTTAGYLRFLKCSYWLPKEKYHLISRHSIRLISGFIGVEGMDDAALDALSALLSLLKSGGDIRTCQLLSLDPKSSDQLVLSVSFIDQSFWNRVDGLDRSYFSSNSSKLFGVWFQWISQAVTDKVDLECLHHDRYWDRVRSGLLVGFGDQRKYCLGIIEQSLRATGKDIVTPTMVYYTNDTHLMEYKKYASLFEMIVLNRYAGQVEASLSELTALLGPKSKITPAMATTLLAAAINSKVQEGIRKLVGNWYIDYVVKVSGLQQQLADRLSCLKPCSRRQSAAAPHLSF